MQTLIQRDIYIADSRATPATVTFSARTLRVRAQLVNRHRAAPSVTFWRLAGADCRELRVSGEV